MADGINDFLVTDHQKNLSEELIVSWTTGALRDISEEMIKLIFFKCIQSMIFSH